MDPKRTLFVALLLIMTHSAYAGIAESEAYTYYREGIKAQTAQNYEDARTAYQKALLLIDDNRSPIKNDMLGRLQQIEQPTPQPAVEAQKPIVPAVFLTPVSAPTPSADIPQQGTVVSKNTGFATNYSGAEPFLQGCDTDMCSKIKLNNEGIRVATEGDLRKAADLFQRSLAIDPTFKPAQENLMHVEALMRSVTATTKTHNDEPQEQESAPNPVLQHSADPTPTPTAPYSLDTHIKKLTYQYAALGYRIDFLGLGIKKGDLPKDMRYIAVFSPDAPFLHHCTTELCQKINFNNKGIALAKNEQFDAAVAMLKDALRIDNRYKDAKVNLALVYASQYRKYVELSRIS